MAKTAAKTSARPRKAVKETPAAPVKDTKPAFGKAPPRRATVAEKVAGAPVVNRARPAAGTAAGAAKNGGGSSIGHAAKVAAAVAVGTVVATAKGVATLASSVTGRSRAKQDGKPK